MALADFVDQMGAPSISALTSPSMPSLTDFSAAAVAQKVDRFGAECCVSDCVYTYSKYSVWSIDHSVSPER